MSDEAPAPLGRSVLLSVVTWFIILLLLGLGGALEKRQIVFVSVLMFGSLATARIARLVRARHATASLDADAG